MKETLKYSALVMVVALLAACDKVPLLAPANSQITLSANATTIPTGGTVGLTAFVTESSGTAVQNGTSVRFTTTLGTVTPSDAQTTNGIAVATFQAGTASGVAEVHAVSGGATGTTAGGGNTAAAANVVKITIGAAAVNTITVAASPTSVSPNGSAVQVTASVLDTSGGSLAGILVTFTADQGVLTPSTAVTDSTGQATTTLVTAVDTNVTATAGTKTGTIKVTARAGPGITITCAVASGTGSSCASVQANASTNSATVTFTVTRATSTSSLRSATINFGDGSSQQLGNLAGGAATATHTYAGPGSSGASGYVATVTATDVNGETTTATSTVTVTARAPLSVALSAAQGTSSGQRTPVTFTATVKPDVGGADVAQSFDWDFDGDGSVDATTSANSTTHVYNNGDGVRTVTVKVTTTDGRTASGQTQVNIP